MSAKSKAGTNGYKALLLEARGLRSEAGKNAFRRASLLVRVFEDAGFRAEIGATDDFDVAEALNAEVEDLCLGFLELRAMLAEFPNEADWQDGRLATLYDKARGQIASRKPEKQIVAKSRVTREELEKVQGEKQDIAARLNFVQQQFAEKVKSYSELESEVLELRMENERLKGRIEELQRLVRAELASV